MGIYRRLTDEDRLRLKAYLETGLSQKEIAVKLGFHKSTISRELARNKGSKGYRPKQAQRLAEERQAWRKEPRKMTPQMIATIERLLEQKWSPEKISNRLKIEGKQSVCHETIYKYVYSDYNDGGVLYKNLRFSHRRRKPRFPRAHSDRRGFLTDTVSIDARGDGANNRSRVGHWERDTMIGLGHQSCILMLVDRKNRYIRLGKLTAKSSDEALRATKKLLSGLPVKSITNDNGKEFADHKKLSKSLGVPVYFCHPYSSNERGTVENRIGSLRQYFPKKTCLKDVTEKELQKIENQLNTRPMKCLDYKTPYEVMFGNSVALTD